MILMIALGLLMSFLGVALGCTVLELTVRALLHSLPSKRRGSYSDNETFTTATTNV
jgi:hypothetical protein